MAVLPTGIGPVTGYNVERSLRFNSADTAYLNRTPSGAGNRKTWTWSGWVKRSALGSSQTIFALFDYLASPLTNKQHGLRFLSGDTIEYWCYQDPSYNGQKITTQVFRDVSAWYHIVAVWDTTNATAANRMRLYVNGSEVTAFGTNTNPTQNSDGEINRAFLHTIGTFYDPDFGSPTNNLNGYLTEVNFVDSPVLVGSTTNASTTVTLTTGTTANIGIGWNVGGTNIPSGATVSSITNSTQFVISSAATGTGSSINIGVTPPVSAFGETDTNTGVWKPKAYTGTYGTNGFYLPFKTASQWSGYFDGNTDYLSVPHNSSLSPTGDFTIEFWAYTGSTALQEWVTKGYGIQIYSNASNWYAALSSSNNTTYFINGSLGAHSTNTWQHIAISRQGNTYRGFVNGVATTLGTSSSAPSTGTDSLLVGTVGPGTIRYYVTGYLSNLRIVDGTAVYTGDFTPPTSQLTAITNTSLLTCQSSTFVDNSTNAFTVTATGDTRPQQFSPFTLDVTDDHSGQGNHWIPNNLDLRTTGIGADILVDSPTAYGTDTGVGGTVRGNYCMLNPLTSLSGRTSLSNGNLQPLGTSSVESGCDYGTIGVSSGKWYWECTVLAVSSASSYPNFGAVRILYGPSNGKYIGDSFTGGTGIFTGGTVYKENSLVTTVSSYTTNDVIGIALDVDNLTCAFYKNGTLLTTVTGLTAGTYWPGIASYYNSSAALNTGQRPFQKWNGSAYVANTAPSGFKALCTQNLPTPTIGATSTTQANDYFDVGLVTGSASVDQTITTAFAPDFYWSKNRNSTIDHGLYNTIAGGNKYLSSNATTTETTTTASVVTFNSTGVSLKAGGSIINDATRTYVGWLWRGGGTGVTNTAGTITSTVSANTTSGFSIVTFTTNNTAGATVGHGLGAVPDMIIMKYRGLAANWVVYHKSMNATPQNGYLNLNTTAGYAALIDPWNNTAPSSTVITMGAGAGSAGSTNYSVYTSVAYCFAAVPGYSAFGSYTGNGAADGPFVYTGFRPRFILLKRSNGVENWQIYDTVRDTYNAAGLQLIPNTSGNEADGRPILDVLSNGFKLRNAAGGGNAAADYIYAAFAEHPFKYSLAR